MIFSTKHNRRVRIVVAALGVSLTAAACGGDDGGGGGGSGGSGATYTIGAVFPLSGQSAAFGEAYQVATDICVQYANDELIEGTMEIEYSDGQGLPAPSVTAMNRLVNVDDALAVLTGFSAPTKALAPIANQAQVPLLNGGASAPDLQGLGDYVFNNIPLADQQVPASVQYVVEDQGLTDWYVIYSNETLGLSMQAAAEELVPDAGGQISGESEIDPQATDFGSQVAAIRDADPDVVFLATTTGGQIPTLIRQIRAAGIEAQLVSYAGVDTPEVLALPEADGLVYTSQAVDYELDQPLTQYFSETFAEENPDVSPTTLQANYCSQMSILGTAIAALEQDGAEVTGEAIQQQITEIGTFDVVGGEVTFQEGGTVELPIDVRQISGGEATVVSTYTPED